MAPATEQESLPGLESESLDRGAARESARLHLRCLLGLAVNFGHAKAGGPIWDLIHADPELAVELAIGALQAAAQERELT